MASLAPFTQGEESEYVLQHFSWRSGKALCSTACRDSRGLFHDVFKYCNIVHAYSPID